MNPTRATPTISAEAVAAERRGLRLAFSRARWPVAPDSLVGAPEINGASVYTPVQQVFGDDPAPLLSSESGAPILAGMDLSRQENLAPEIPIDLPKRDTNRESLELAELLVQELNGATRMVKLQPVQAGFVVLTSPEMPSVLVELGYLSNPADEQALADDAHLARLATAIARAVEVYFGAGRP